MPDRSIAARCTCERRSAGCTVASPPLRRPRGVRTASTMTTWLSLRLATMCSRRPLSPNELIVMAGCSRANAADTRSDVRRRVGARRVQRRQEEGLAADNGCAGWYDRGPDERADFGAAPHRRVPDRVAAVPAVADAVDAGDEPRARAIGVPHGRRPPR